MPNPSHRIALGRGAALACTVPLFFVWGFLTSLNDVLIPHVKSVFELDYARAMLVKTAFFSAFLLVPMLAARWVARYPPNIGMGAGLAIAALGAFSFVPAAGLGRFPLFLLALFVLAAGAIVLQLTAMPFVAQLGQAATSASRLTLAQGLYSLGTALAPLVGAAVLFGDSHVAAVQHAYVVLAALLGALAWAVYRLRLPSLSIPSGDVQPPARALLKHRPLRGALVAVFFFIGAEIAMGSLLILYAGLPQIAGLAAGKAAMLVSLYWTAAMLGRFAGAALMLRFAAHRLRLVAAVTNMILLGFVVLAEGRLPLYCLVATGLFNSIILPSLFAQGIAGLGPQATAGAGLLLMGIAGGALIPVLQGALADRIGLQLSFVVPVVCYLAVVVVGSPRVPTEHEA